MQETYKIEKKNWAAKLMAIVVVVTMVTSTFVLFAPEASARTGEETDVGYTFVDNRDGDPGAPTYDWKELVTALGGSATSTLLLSSTTDGAQPMTDIGFTFEMFGREYTEWSASGDNGFISLGAQASSMWTPYHIPYASAGTAIFGGWFDGGFCRSKAPHAGVYYDLQGTEGSREFIVQYQDQVHWYPSVTGCGAPGGTDGLTWQIILYEGSNNIKIQWKDANGGYGSDDEWLTSGIQGKTDDGVLGLEYIYRGDPNEPDDGDAVLFTPPPPLQNDLKLKSTTIPDPVSLADANIFGAEVFNNGVNCTPVESCTPVNETNIEVNTQIFSVAETDHEYTFDSDDGGFTPMSIQGINPPLWTTNLNDGKGDHNYGDEGAAADPADGAWSSGRKSGTLGGMFNDNQKIHSDGTHILVADTGSDSILKLDTSTHSTTTVLGPDATNLQNVLDVTEDGTYYYTLGRAASTYSMTTVVCKWQISDGAQQACNSSSVRYGVALTYYDGEVFVLQGGSTSTSYRKAIILDATNLAATGETVDYYSGVSSYSFAHDIDADESNGDIYIAYRDYYGRVRAYEEQADGNYCATSACYSQYYAYTRYHQNVDVIGDKAYTTGYYSSSYAGGLRHADTTTKVVTSMWTSYGDNFGYRGSLAVTDDGDVYVTTSYQYRYYYFRNFDDKILHYDCSASCNNQADAALGPNPASLSALSTPAYDTSASIGMSMSFKVSWQFYYMYEGAYLEVSTDGGSNWAHVPDDKFTKGGYYGMSRGYYGNPLDLTKDSWTYYNTENRYTYNTNTAPWKEQEVNLDAYTGYSDVRLRWVVGFNQYSLSYYDSYFRLDDVVVTLKGADQTFADSTETIDTLAFKDSTTVNFFDGEDDKWIPSQVGLVAGDTVAVLIKINNLNNDQKMANNRIIEFREVKYVIFNDDFESGDKGWTDGSVTMGVSTWGIDSNDAFGGTYSMDSGMKNPGGMRPADNYIASPALDLSIAVEATAQFMMSYYGYYTYDGYQAQVSEDGGATWSMVKPVDTSQYYTMVNSAYWGNPLRGQPGYSYYGTSSGFTWAPDPQGWVKTEIDLTPYVGQNDVHVRIVTGWSNLCCGAYYQTFFRMDDFAVTGVVHMDNVGLAALDLPDPIEVGSTLPIGTSIINAGLNDQPATAAKMRVQLGPMGIVDMTESDSIDYASQGAATTAGWSMSTGTEGCNTTYSTCGSWGLYGGVTGFALVTDDGSSIDGTHTGFGPATIRDEFQMYYGGGENHVETPAYDFSSAPDDLSLTLNHRYNFDYYSGMRAYNGGNVQISTDGGASWDILVPEGGYPGSIYNYAGYGNPLYGQQGFVHCGDCSGVSGSAGSNADKYIDTLFDMSDYAGESDVRIKFVAGMYSYQWPGDGEHWHIGALTFSGTGMDKVIFTETVQVTGTGAGGTFVSGEAVSKSWDYEFIVPGEYKVVFDAWIGANPEDGDDYAADNQRSAVRETMFAVASTTADGERITPEGEGHYESVAYADEWTSVVEGGPKDSYKWQHSSAAGGPDSGAPVWWTGTDAYGSSYNGDDTSLVSPVFDLSTASSAKFMMKHRFSMHGYQYSWGGYYYDGGRLEISSNGGQSWSPVTPTSGETYTGNIYNYAFYGHPFVNQPAFIMGSSGGGVTGSWVTSEVRLDDYCGEGFDQMQFRIRLGGTYFNNPTSWQVDDVGIYGLGFDLSQDAASAPYTLELDEAGTITTKVSNQGAGDLGAGGVLNAAYAYAYVDEYPAVLDQNGEVDPVWEESISLGNLAQAYFEENTDGDGNPLGTFSTYVGQSTDEISFTFPGTDMPGVYTIGVRIADANGDVLSDLFGSNNQHQHMLVVGMSADMGSPVLTADDTWTQVTDEPSYVGDGALGTSWDKTAINTIVQDISIDGMAYSPADVTVQVGTVVKWTNDDSASHTVSDKDGVWAGSGPMSSGTSWSKVFSEVGTYTYYCEFHPMMEGTITVEADIRADQQVRTNYMEIWSSDSYLVFWANYDLGSADQITVYAQPKGASIEDASTIRLDGANGFEIVDGMNHGVVGDSLVGNSDGWNPYYMSLTTTKLGYSTLDYDPESDNAYSFVFRARGIDGSAEIGGVQLIRTNEFGMYFSKTDFSKLTYEIFPSLAVEIDYMARNIGTKDNTFQMTPALILQGNKDADVGYWEITPNVLVNGEAVTASKVDDTYSISLSPDDLAHITMRFVAPTYNQEKAQPAGNSKFDVDMSPFDVESNETLRDDPKSTLFIKPSQFVLGEMSFNKAGVIEGTNVSITVKAWNEGNYASDVLVVMYMLDPSGTMYATPEGNQRMTRIAHTTVPLMAPKPVLDSQGEYKYWYEATAVWDEATIPGTTAQDFETVDVYAWINPFPLEQVDKDAGFKPQDEFQDQNSDNDASGIINIVKDKASTPSFAVGLLGMSMAALVAAIGASLRREEE